MCWRQLRPASHLPGYLLSLPGCVMMGEGHSGPLFNRQPWGESRLGHKRGIMRL